MEPEEERTFENQPGKPRGFLPASLPLFLLLAIPTWNSVFPKAFLASPLPS